MYYKKGDKVIITQIINDSRGKVNEECWFVEYGSKLSSGEYLVIVNPNGHWLCNYVLNESQIRPKDEPKDEKV